MFTPETPITDHPQLPEDVPLIAGFHDDRNRLSYYTPRLEGVDGVETPVTKFFEITGSADDIVTVDYREITKFLQEIPTRKGFIRSDFSSAKRCKMGRVLTSHDPHDIEATFAMLVDNHIRTQRHLGGRIAVREYIPHDIEVRYFIRDGDILYHQQHTDVSSYPDSYVSAIANEFDHFAWSVDVIKHEHTGEWFCTDMGLDGLYPNGSSDWVAISEHPDQSYSPEKESDRMPVVDRFSYTR